MLFYPQGRLISYLISLFIALILFYVNSSVPSAYADINKKPSNENQQILSYEAKNTKLSRSHRRFEQTLRVVAPASSNPVRFRVGLLKKTSKKNLLNHIDISGLVLLDVYGESCDQPLTAYIRITNKNMTYRYIKFTNPIPINSDWTVSVEYLGKHSRKHEYKIQLGDEHIQVSLDSKIKQIQQDISGANLIILNEVIL